MAPARSMIAKDNFSCRFYIMFTILDSRKKNWQLTNHVIGVPFLVSPLSHNCSFNPLYVLSGALINWIWISNIIASPHTQICVLILSLHICMSSSLYKGNAVVPTCTFLIICIGVKSHVLCVYKEKHLCWRILKVFKNVPSTTT